MNRRVSVSASLALAGTAGVLLIQSFLPTRAQAPASPPSTTAANTPQAMQAQIDRMQAQIAALQAEVKRLKAAQGPSNMLKITPLPTSPAPETFAVPLKPDTKPLLIPSQPYNIYVQPSPLPPDSRLNVLPAPPQRYTNIPPTRIIQLQQPVPSGDLVQPSR